jgi:hypothetical protein
VIPANTTATVYVPAKDAVGVTEYGKPAVPDVVAQRIVHGAAEHLELLFGPVVAMTLSIADGSAIIPAFP